MTKFENLKKVLSSYDYEITDEQLGQFVDFEKYLKEYNNHTNLVSANDIELIWEKHFIDSVAFCHYLKNDTALRILDIGSGGGFPVIMESILLPDSNIFALDSTAKKTTFLKNAADIIGLKNLSVINDRAEEIAYRKTFRETFDIVSARAVGSLVQIAELALPFLKIGGCFIAYKASKVEEEISEAKNAIDILGGQLEDVFEYKLELQERNKCLL